jgi:hypothetical protein
MIDALQEIRTIHEMTRNKLKLGDRLFRVISWILVLRPHWIRSVNWWLCEHSTKLRFACSVAWENCFQILRS